MSVKKLSLPFAVLLAVASFALAFHHHSDGVAHPDCSLCTAQSEMQAASLGPQAPGQPVFPEALLAPLREGARASSSLGTPPVIRPPPA